MFKYLKLAIIVFLEWTLYVSYKQIHIKSTQLDGYKLKALTYIYFSLGRYRKANKRWTRTNAKQCQGKDLRGIHHPDTIMDDVYMANLNDPWEYQDFYSKTHALYANEYTKKSNIKRINWNMISYDPYPSRIYPCIFDKLFSLLLKPDPHQKSTMTFIQNKLINKLTANNASEACIKEARFNKPSLFLSNKEECLKVMDILNKKEYMRGELPLGYLLKSNAHLQKGVRFLKEPVVQQVLSQYGNGTKCGAIKRNLILQEFIPNPVLWKKRAFTIRIYLLFVSARPWITYIYQESVLHVCIQPWSTHELSPYRQLCNGDFSHKFFETPEHKRPKLEDVGTMDIVKPCPTHIDFARMLLEQGHIKSLSWLETDFYPKIVKKLTHLLHHGSSTRSDPRLSQLFGIDFELDTDGNFWILDYNTYPSYYAQTVERRLYMKRFFDNTVGLLKMYMKQKYLRIKKLIETVLVPYFKKYGASSRITVDIHRKIDIALTDTYLPDKVINNYKKVDLRQGSAICKEYYK